MRAFFSIAFASSSCCLPGEMARLSIQSCHASAMLIGESPPVADAIAAWNSRSATRYSLSATFSAAPPATDCGLAGGTGGCRLGTTGRAVSRPATWLRLFTVGVRLSMRTFVMLRSRTAPRQRRQTTVCAAMSSIAASASLRTRRAVSDAIREPILAILPVSDEYSVTAFWTKPE